MHSFMKVAAVKKVFGMLAFISQGIEYRSIVFNFDHPVIEKISWKEKIHENVVRT